MKYKRQKIEKFWIEDPTDLLINFCEFNPLIAFENKPLSNVINSFTRLIIICILINIMNMLLTQYIH